MEIGGPAAAKGWWIAAIVCAMVSTHPLAAQPQATAAGIALPPQSACPAVANVDLPRVARLNARAAAEAEADQFPPSTDLDEVVVPSTASRRPPPDATFIARVRVPAGGMYPADERAVVWRESDGSWWGWRTVFGVMPVSGPPPAPGAEEEEFARRPWAWEGYPPYEGRLSPEQSAFLEAAWANPCRRLEPDFWPWEIPVLRAEQGRRVRRCARYQDATRYIAEFTEQGRPPRPVGMRCGSVGTLNAVLITNIAHVELPRAAPRKIYLDATEPGSTPRP